MSSSRRGGGGAAGSRRMVEGALKRAAAQIELGNFYEAQQHYQTAYNRSASRKRWGDAVKLLLHGARTLLEHGQGNAGGELARLLTEALPKFRAAESKQKGDLLSSALGIANTGSAPEAAAAGAAAAAAAAAAGADGSKRKLLPEDVRTLREVGDAFPKGDAFVGTRVRFLKSCVNLCAGTAEEAGVRLDLARVLSASGDHGLAQRHWLRSGEPDEHAAELVSWSALGYPSERDLFVTRAVLQYLCIERPGDAATVLEAYARAFSGEEAKQASAGKAGQSASAERGEEGEEAKTSSQAKEVAGGDEENVGKGAAPAGPAVGEAKEAGGLDTPLVSFCRLLVKATERESPDLFDLLRVKYAASLARDGQLEKYVQKIGALYFGKQMPKGLLDNMMATLFENDE